MRSLIYWMIFQMIVSIWLFISPLVIGFREMTAVAVNNMFGDAVVAILGLGVSLYELYHRETLGGVEHMEKRGV